MLEGKNVALYVTGGIAVYKACDLVRQLIKEGAEVQVAMSRSACKFVSPLTFQILSKRKVYTDLFEETEYDEVSHIHLSDWANLSIVAPATANVMARMACGLADDFITASLLAASSPVLVVPAMNMHMWNNEATKENKKILERRGIHLMDPDIGFLAEGYSGKGRFPENSRIVQKALQVLKENSTALQLKNRRFLVTAGGTKERIDPVRYLTNDSSGKMGYALAEAAANEGAVVTLITASKLPVPSGVTVVPVESAQEMEQAALSVYKEMDVIIMAAAVSDYRPVQTAVQKIKKHEETMELHLEKTPDILKEMGKQKKSQFLIGFAAETENVKEYALKKLKEKNLDIIAANDVSRADSGFNVDRNEVTLYTKEGTEHFIPSNEKKKVAEEMILFIADQLREE